MKNSHLMILKIIPLLIVLLCACNGKSTQAILTKTPVQATNSKFSEIVTGTFEPDSSVTPDHASTIQPDSTATITEMLPTATTSPEPYPGNAGSIPDPNIIQNPYPLATDGVQIIDGNSSPYPGPPSDTPNVIQTQDPYPGALMETPFPGTAQGPYPAPGGNGAPGATQPVAINPIQTPAASETIMVSNNMSATATTIVRTTLRATDPTTVQLISGKYQLIEFFAYWCPACKSMAPVINGLEGKYQGRLSFVYLDIDNPLTENFQHALGYKNQPHFFLLDGEGKILHQWRGFTLVNEFEAVLTPLFP